MQRFEAYEDGDGKWRWRLWASNGKIIASSDEAFFSQASALRAAEGVRAAAGGAKISIAPGLGIKAAQRLRALLGDDDSARIRASRKQRPRVRAVGRAEQMVKARRVSRMSGPSLRVAKSR
jgi:uncharacterized protein YegP (UPF0339 family)